MPLIGAEHATRFTGGYDCTGPYTGDTPPILFCLAKRECAAPGGREKRFWSHLDTGVKVGDAALLAPLWKIVRAYVGAGPVLLKLWVEAPR